MQFLSSMVLVRTLIPLGTYSNKKLDLHLRLISSKKVGVTVVCTTTGGKNFFRSSEDVLVVEEEVRPEGPGSSPRGGGGRGVEEARVDASVERAANLLLVGIGRGLVILDNLACFLSI